LTALDQAGGCHVTDACYMLQQISAVWPGSIVERIAASVSRGDPLVLVPGSAVREHAWAALLHVGGDDYMARRRLVCSAVRCWADAQLMSVVEA
jgi:hypothetical protein